MNKSMPAYTLSLNDEVISSAKSRGFTEKDVDAITDHLEMLCNLGIRLRAEGSVGSIINTDRNWARVSMPKGSCSVDTRVIVDIQDDKHVLMVHMILERTGDTYKVHVKKAWLEAA